MLLVALGQFLERRSVFAEMFSKCRRVFGQFHDITRFIVIFQNDVGIGAAESE